MGKYFGKLEWHIQHNYMIDEIHLQYVNQFRSHLLPTN